MAKNRYKGLQCENNLKNTFCQLVLVFLACLATALAKPTNFNSEKYFKLPLDCYVRGEFGSVKEFIINDFIYIFELKPSEYEKRCKDNKIYVFNGENQLQDKNSPFQELIASSKSKMVVDYDNVLNLFCLFKNSSPDITWKKDNKKLLKTEKNSYGSILTIPSLKEAAVYKCISANVSQMFDVEITGKSIEEVTTLNNVKVDNLNFQVKDKTTSTPPLNNTSYIDNLATIITENNIWVKNSSSTTPVPYNTGKRNKSVIDNNNNKTDIFSSQNIIYYVLIVLVLIVLIISMVAVYLIKKLKNEVRRRDTMPVSVTSQEIVDESESCLSS